MKKMTPNILSDLSIKISQYFLEFLESDNTLHKPRNTQSIHKLKSQSFIVVIADF